MELKSIKGKKGAEMTIGTVIMIILAIVVLVFLIYSFSRGSGGFLDNIKNFFGGGTNVDTVKNACLAACSTNQKYQYESVRREVVFEDKSKVYATCKELEASIEAGCYTKDFKKIALTNNNKETCTSIKWGKVGTNNVCVSGSTEVKIGDSIVPQENCVGLWIESSKAIGLNACTSLS